jgi:3-hydroxypropanoate dehydrogenase
MSGTLDAASLDLVFHKARTHFKWLDKPVDDALLKKAYELAALGPTSANIQPARFIFVKSKAAKERLKPALSEGNTAKTMAAPVTAIIGYDLEFYENLPRTFPHEKDAKSWFNWSKDHAEKTAFRNGTLTAAYFILALRGLGLDCGPMSGFDNAKVDAEFFPDGRIKSNFLMNIGYGDASVLFPRQFRLPFDEAAQIL